MFASLAILGFFKSLLVIKLAVLHLICNTPRNVHSGESKLSNCEAREYIFDPEVRQFQRVIP